MHNSTTLGKLAPAFLVASLSFFAAAQRTSNSTSGAGILIVQSTSVYKTSDMQFGTIVPGTSGGTVILSTSGSRSKTGSILLPSGGSASAAAYVVLGSPSTTFSVSYPNSITLNRTGGGASMNVSSIVGSPTLGGTLSSGGSANVYVGGTLTVSANQTFGQYTGTFNVTVSYP